MASPAQARGLTRIFLFDCPARHGRPNQVNDTTSVPKWHLELASACGSFLEGNRCNLRD